MFSGFHCESRFHLLESFFQKGLVDEGATELPFKVIQDHENSGDIFPISLRVDRFIAQMRQTFRSTIGDQFLDGGLHKRVLSVSCGSILDKG